MDKFAHNRYTLGKIRLGKQTLRNHTNSNLTLGKFTRVYLPLINLPIVFYPWYGITKIVVIILNLTVIVLSRSCTLRNTNLQQKNWMLKIQFYPSPKNFTHACL